MLNKILSLQGMNKKGERRGGRQKGTPNKLTAEKLLTNYINECLEKRRTYDATENKPEELAAFALCVQALETIKRNRQRDGENIERYGKD